MAHASSIAGMASESGKREACDEEDGAISLRCELERLQIKHKEECYWLRLEVDSLRREREAGEERMAEFVRDVREMERSLGEDEDGSPVCIDASYVSHLQSQLSRSVQSIGVLDNQISMVKISCDEVVKSLKEEIADVMDDKTSMEIGLMNQLVRLDTDKNDLERRLHDRLAHDRLLLADRDAQIDALTRDIRALRSSAASESAAASEAIHRERLETASHLDRVAHIWQSADEAVQTLAHVLDRLRPIDRSDDDRPLDQISEQPHHASRDRALTTLDTATLVHGQIKLSLLLIELKLRNGLTTLKHDEMRLTEHGGMGANLPMPIDPAARMDSNRSVNVGLVGMGASPTAYMLEVMDKAADIQRETLMSLRHVEETLSDQIRLLQDTVQHDENVQHELNERADAVGILRQRSQELEKNAQDARIKCEETEKSKRELERTFDDLQAKLEDLNLETKELEIKCLDLKEENKGLMSNNEGLSQEIERVRAEAAQQVLAAERATELHHREHIQQLQKELELRTKELHLREMERDQLLEQERQTHNAKEKDIANDTNHHEEGSRAASPKFAVTQEMMAQMQHQIFAVVGRIKEKNEQIVVLSAAVDEFKVREAALKKELKRKMKQVRTMEDGNAPNGSNRATYNT